MMKNQGCNPVNAIETALDDQFFLPFIVSDRSQEIQQAARNKLIQFVKERAEDMKQIKEVEAMVEFPLQKATVTGRIDVLLHDGNCIEIRDYKTSKDSTTHPFTASSYIHLVSKFRRYVHSMIYVSIA